MAIPKVTNFSLSPQKGQVGFYTDMNTWINEHAGVMTSINTMLDSVDATVIDINAKAVVATTQASLATTKATSASASSTTATTKANEAAASAASALASKVAIDAKVIPTEATYNYAYLDNLADERDLEDFLDFKF